MRSDFKSRISHYLRAMVRNRSLAWRFTAVASNFDSWENRAVGDLGLIESVLGRIIEGRVILVGNRPAEAGLQDSSQTVSRPTKAGGGVSFIPLKYLRRSLSNFFCLMIILLSRPCSFLAADSNIEGIYNAAYEAFQQGNLASARDQLIQVLKLRTDIPEAHNLLGVVYDRMGNGEKARQHFEVALKLNPDFLEVRSNLAQHLVSRGNLQAALKLVHKEFKEPDVHYLMVMALRRKKAYSKALEHALETTRLYPDYPLTHLYAATELQFRGELQQAQGHFEKAATLGEGVPKVQIAARFGLASTLAKKGDYEAAMPLLRSIISSNPNDIDARLELGNIFFKTRAYADAIKLAEEIVSMDAQERRAHFLLSNALRRLGRVVEAEKHFRVFQELEKTSSSTDKGKAAIYAKSRD